MGKKSTSARSRAAYPTRIRRSQDRASRGLDEGRALSPDLFGPEQTRRRWRRRPSRVGHGRPSPATFSGVKPPARISRGRGGMQSRTSDGHGRAGASRLARHIGVDQDRVRRRGPSTRARARYSLTAAPVRGAAQPKCSDDLKLTECEQVFRRFLAVQLNDLQTELFRDIGHFARPDDQRTLPRRTPTAEAHR